MTYAVVEVVRPRENILQQANEQLLVLVRYTLALDLVQSNQAQIRGDDRE